MFTISLEAFDFTIPLLLTSLHSFSPQALVFQYLFEEQKVPIFSFDQDGKYIVVLLETMM